MLACLTVVGGGRMEDVATHDKGEALGRSTCTETWSSYVAANSAAHAHLANPSPRSTTPSLCRARCLKEAVQAAAACHGTE